MEIIALVMQQETVIVLSYASHYYKFPFLPALLAQLIPNTTATHTITYTNFTYVLFLPKILLIILKSSPIINFTGSVKTMSKMHIKLLGN